MYIALKSSSVAGRPFACVCAGGRNCLSSARLFGKELAKFAQIATGASEVGFDTGSQLELLKLNERGM